jgi:phage RecT family recombinase
MGVGAGNVDEKKEDKQISVIFYKNIIEKFGENWDEKEKKEASILVNYYLSKAKDDQESGNPQLWSAINADDAARASFIRCISKAVSLKLSSSPNELFYLIPRKDKVTEKTMVTFQLSYFGALDFAYRAKTQGVLVQPVFECDEFKISYGSNANCVHNPDFKGRIGKKPYLYYAVVTLQSGQQIVEAMSVEEIEARRQRYSKKARFSPWDDEFGRDAMSRKTVLLKALKFAPKTTELIAALNSEDKEDVLEPEQEQSHLIDVSKQETQQASGELF